MVFLLLIEDKVPIEANMMRKNTKLKIVIRIPLFGLFDGKSDLNRMIFVVRLIVFSISFQNRDPLIVIAKSDVTMTEKTKAARQQG